MYQPNHHDFQTLIEAMPICTILHDAQSKDILWANTAALSALGFTLEELIPLKAPDMTRDAPKYKRSIGLRWLERAARSGQRTIEWCYRSKAGVEILSEAVATLVHLDGRDVLMVQFRDISREDKVKRDLIHAEEARRVSEQQLEYLARYNAMGEMAVAIAHELSQPLAATRNFIEGALIRLGDTHSADQGVHWGLQSAVRQVEHASTIIKSVRDYVVKLEQSAERVDLNELLHETQYFISLRAEPSQVRLEITPSAEPLMVHCERVLIGQVILNLAFNGIEEMSGLPVERRVLRLRACRDDGVARLSVEDCGRGIQAVAQEKIFDGFFSSKVGGNGIGLALCKNIIGRHHGDIWAQNLEPCGAVFSFSLPLVGV
ncbi:MULTISPECIES: sensor histidine kinase [unclassified Pseudomonas]|uniref:sensor histidine kinase n=1 Tax=unclassified Pseudomonas TaxID=196821 RepID=UPI0015A115D3|nr:MULTISPECIES: PAS domain-containing sensor histidine kinase [unclassified Pseudomonas]NWC96862.1 PAS domain-containing sensor histidine kinase [Pseudomonas sp. IPO3779]NWD20642.1 PAS domain-containing sensor histidine kinase [Pseudomonas sp. IPO3778]